MTETGNPQPKSELLRRIRGISLANFAIGAVEAAAGILMANSTLTTAAIHDVSDCVLYEIKHSAAKEEDSDKKTKKRRVGAWSLIAVAGSLGGTEIVRGLLENGRTEPATVAVAGVALVANCAAALFMHGHHDGNARDTWRHLAHADLPGAFATVGATTAVVATGNHLFDALGAAINTALAASVGLRTLRDTSNRPPAPHQPWSPVYTQFGLQNPLFDRPDGKDKPPCQL